MSGLWGLQHREKERGEEGSEDGTRAEDYLHLDYEEGKYI